MKLVEPSVTLYQLTETDTLSVVAILFVVLTYHNFNGADLA